MEESIIKTHPLRVRLQTKRSPHYVNVTLLVHWHLMPPFILCPVWLGHNCTCWPKPMWTLPLREAESFLTALSFFIQMLHILSPLFLLDCCYCALVTVGVSLLPIRVCLQFNCKEKWHHGSYNTTKVFLALRLSPLGMFLWDHVVIRCVPPWALWFQNDSSAPCCSDHKSVNSKQRLWRFTEACR